MAGIYIHVPFCKQACSYCNFYFVTSDKLQNDYHKALLHEIDERAGFLDNRRLGSIYFGGGTPSRLSTEQLESVLSAISKRYDQNSNIEITLEANPEDINPAILSEWKNIGINRLSIGIQSFRDEDLKLMNRAHDTRGALEAIHEAERLNFQLSIDLIYGLPNLSLNDWSEHLKRATDLQIDHLSCYALTVEPQTRLEKDIRLGKVQMPSDEMVAEQFLLMREQLQSSGFEHYEISNFARNKRYAVHNTNYWKFIPYLGLGPGAHSFDGKNRFINPPKLKDYINSVNRFDSFLEIDPLNDQERFNEMVMIGLRTKWGISMQLMQESLGDQWVNSLHEKLKQISPSFLSIQEDNVRLTEAGLLLADRIASDLMVTE